MSATPLPPGPRAPHVVQALRYTFDLPRLFTSCRRRYGATWTLRLPGFPPCVVTTERDAIRSLFTGDPLTKRHASDVLAPLVGRHSLMLLDPPEHLARRRLELPPFHGERIRVYEERVRARIEHEVASWKPGVVEVHPRAKDITLDVILELVLGVGDRRLHARLAAIFEAMVRPQNNLGMFMPAWLQSRRNPFSRPFWSLLDRLHAVLGEHIAATRADASLDKREDVLAMLVLARDDQGRRLSDAQLRDELVTLVSAGYETSATAIAWGAELLAHHPDVAEQLRDGDREYRAAAAKEVLRARPVVPVSAARRPLEPLAVAGYTIGDDAAVLVNAYDLHRDPDLHPDPQAFRPERFLNDAADGYAYVPFGGGAHRCLGAPLAMLELELALEAIASRCTLAPAAPAGRAVRRGVTLAPASRGRVSVEAKLRAHAGERAPAR